MKKNRKKWLGLVLAVTVIAVGAASLTAFGAEHQTKAYSAQVQSKQTLCTVNQDCFQQGVHHTRTKASTTSTVAQATGTSTSSAYSNCQYPDCDGTHANHQSGNHNYGYHDYGKNHHGSSHGGGHHGGGHE